MGAGDDLDAILDRLQHDRGILAFAHQHHAIDDVVFRVLAGSLAGRDEAVTCLAPVDPVQERVALALAVISVLLGMMPLASFGLVQIGR